MPSLFGDRHSRMVMLRRLMRMDLARVRRSREVHHHRRDGDALLALFHLWPAITLNDVPICCLPATSSALLWTHHSTIYNASKWPWCLTSNPVGYISRLLLTELIQYRSCSCLNNIFSSTRFHLTTAYCSWMSMPRWEDFVPEVPAAPAKRPQVTASQVRLFCSWGCWHAYQQAAGHNFASPPCFSFRRDFTRGAVPHISRVGPGALVARSSFLSVAQVPAL